MANGNLEYEGQDLFYNGQLITFMGSGNGGNSNPTFGLPADIVALIEKNYGTVANYLRLRNQGQV